MDYYNGKKRLEQTWRWFGPSDPVPLAHVAQAGATGVVSALHHIPNGEVWPLEAIEAHRDLIAATPGLRWSVVESVPVHEDIKKRTGNYARYIENYKTTLKNLATAGIHTVCYNFMPVLDWTRTELEHPMPDGSTALYFDRAAFVAFDTGILKRPGAEADYSAQELKAAADWLGSASSAQKERLVQTILAGLPGAEEAWTLRTFGQALQSYSTIGEQQLREHLVAFLAQVAQTASELGIMLTIHPDDPPFPLLGLPRVVSHADDVRYLRSEVPLPANGLCFCTGSFGVDPANNLPAMAEEFAPHVGFVHLRSTLRDQAGNFQEADHLQGDVDMFAVMKALLVEQQRRSQAIPMRPDHGHKMLDDLGKTTNPGYSAIGRLRGLAELRGLELGILRSMP